VFPKTQDLTNTLLGWVLTPAKKLLHSIINFLPNLFTILVIYFFTSYLVKAIKYFATEIEKGNITLAAFHKEFAIPTFNILRFILYAFMLVIVFPYLPGSDSPAFQGVSVFLGILISLGSSSAINNIIAGLVITYMRPFKIGDRVKIGETIGDVIEKTTLVIRIRTIKNEDITVPNSTVLSSNTINYSANATNLGLILNTTVTIGYDVPWKDMHQALINAALRTEFILKEPVPFVLQTSLDDFYVSYQMKPTGRQLFIQTCTKTSRIAAMKQVSKLCRRITAHYAMAMQPQFHQAIFPKIMRLPHLK
jgi:small-conductance mechanosensitive channel